MPCLVQIVGFPKDVMVRRGIMTLRGNLSMLVCRLHSDPWESWGCSTDVSHYWFMGSGVLVDIDFHRVLVPLGKCAA